ncbi:MAG: dethiobiotin synthase [Pirellulaceae bacterium]
MNTKPTHGLFVTGTGTEVGKTHVAALIAKTLTAAGCRVGVYKPVASGCRLQDGKLICDDAVALWTAAGEPESLEAVCPQCFGPALAPHLAARAEGKEVDAQQLLDGAAWWKDRCDLLIVEGAGGLMSPLAEDVYSADVAHDLGYPVIVVAANELGTINATLQTLITAATFRDGLNVAGVVLNDVRQAADDASTASNRQELEARCIPPVLAHVGWQAERFNPPIDWKTLAGLD